MVPIVSILLTIFRIFSEPSIVGTFFQSFSYLSIGRQVFSQDNDYLKISFHFYDVQACALCWVYAMLIRDFNQLKNNCLGIRTCVHKVFLPVSPWLNMLASMLRSWLMLTLSLNPFRIHVTRAYLLHHLGGELNKWRPSAIIIYSYFIDNYYLHLKCDVISTRFTFKAWILNCKTGKGLRCKNSPTPPSTYALACQVLAAIFWACPLFVHRIPYALYCIWRLSHCSLELGQFINSNRFIVLKCFRMVLFGISFGILGRRWTVVSEIQFRVSKKDRKCQSQDDRISRVVNYSRNGDFTVGYVHGNLHASFALYSTRRQLQAKRNSSCLVPKSALLEWSNFRLFEFDHVLKNILLIKIMAHTVEKHTRMVTDLAYTLVWSEFTRSDHSGQDQEQRDIFERVDQITKSQHWHFWPKQNFKIWFLRIISCSSSIAVK